MKMKKLSSKLNLFIGSKFYGRVYKELLELGLPIKDCLCRSYDEKRKQKESEE